MNLSRRDLVLTAAAAAALPSFAWAADKKKDPPPAKKVFRFWDIYLGIPAAERTRFAMNWYLRLNGKPTSGQALYLVMPNGSRVLMTQAPDGRITRMPTLAEWKDAVLEADETKRDPNDKFSLSMELNPVLKLGETVSAADVQASIDQCNTAIKKRAGVIGFAVPKMEQVLFSGAGSGQALAGAKVAPLPVFKTYVAFKPADHPGAQSLKFARTPNRGTLAGGKLK